jgi:ABC-type phosphate transport system auxiliary subunit
MRAWQRRTHPWLWLLVAAAVATALALLVGHDPAFFSLS